MKKSSTLSIFSKSQKKTSTKIETIKNWEWGNNPDNPVGGVFTGLGVGGGINPFGYGGWLSQENQISQPMIAYANLRWWFISNLRQFLSQLYCEIGLVQKIVNLPVEDALRGGITIKSKQIDEEEINRLGNTVDRNSDLRCAGQGEKWSRLFGGGGVIIFTDQDPETPLDMAAIGPDSMLQFKAVDLWEIFWDKQMINGWDPDSEDDFEYYSYYGQNIHKSRVLRYKGLVAPSFLRPRLRGWGFSVVEALIRPLNHYLKAQDLTLNVLDEFKIDIYKIKNYASSLLSPIGRQKIESRIRYGNWNKNYNNALIMDTEDDWGQKQLTFAGLSEVSADNRIQIASELSIPLTRIFGISAAGFNSGEDDIEVYNSMIESTIREKLKYPILRILELRCQQMFGFVPDDLSFDFEPLRVLSAEQEENVKTQKFTRLIQSVTAGLISSEEFRDACNKSNIFDIKLEDVAMGQINPQSDTKAEEGKNDPYKPADVEDPGTASVDTPYPKRGEGGAGDRPVTEKGNQPSLEDNDNLLAKKPEEPEKPKKNSASYDVATYEAAGGDGWLDSRRLEFYNKPADIGLYDRAKEESIKAFGSENKKFSIWLYIRKGGKFSFKNALVEIPGQYIALPKEFKIKTSEVVMYDKGKEDKEEEEDDELSTDVTAQEKEPE